MISSASVAVVVAVIIAIMVIFVVAVVPAIAVAVVVVIPTMVVLETAAIPVPVAYKILAVLMAWPNPAGSRVWRPRPIAFVPLVVPSDRIPVALDPYKIRPRTWREHANDARGRWRPNVDPNRNLSGRRDCSSQQKSRKR
jgi:hypothetical protein